jgi:predicted N-acetyltransferase YhbS
VYTVRHAREEDLGALPGVERAAGALFAERGLGAGFAETTPPAELREALAARLLWVAVTPADEVVGFALASVFDGCVHLDELDVRPEHGRRGLGRALVEAVCAAALARGFSAVTLTTLLEVPWNAPYYERLGFRALGEPELSPALRGLLRQELARGIGGSGRVAMRRPLQAEAPR